ncbi:DUF1801 domain-containing protein [Algoriphagus confluentis]|uniref:YdhG-like domain-containing protein n=1 Tax=Algoriphagus confluentis TaxID=1697556 RepID=A0ABQ6PKV7_9BACT|nr:hypothetical protein Aconfl_05270 [Algoriphagus confluentis]
MKNGSLNPCLEYLSMLSNPEGRILSQLRAEILEEFPDFEERLCRGVPFFYFLGKRVAGYGVAQRHLSFYVMDGQALRNRGPECKDMDISATVIRFSKERMIPYFQLRPVLLERVGEIQRSRL